MKKKNAFTLIELLAIIVILAIIAVITIPILLNVIENARKGASIDSAYGYKDSVQQYYLSKSVGGTTDNILATEVTKTVSELEADGLTVNGQKPSDGWVKINKGQVVDYSLKFGEYVVNYDESTKTPISTKGGKIEILESDPSWFTYSTNEDNTLIITGFSDEYKNNHSDITDIVIPSKGEDGTKITSIGQEAFANNLDLTSVVISNGIMSIEYGAFAQNSPGNSNLKNVVISDSVKTIGQAAFINSQLENITIGNNVETIGIAAFLGAKLEELTIPNSVTTIGAAAFNNISTLRKLNIGSNVSSIGDMAFDHTSITNLIIPNSVTTIGASAFGNISLLKNVSIGSGITNYNSNIFSNSNNIETLEIALRDIPAEAFAERSNLKNVKLTNNVNKIGTDSFRLTGIEEITIPDSVTTIGNNAFKDVSALQKVSIGSGVTSIGKSAFEGTAIEELVIPDNVITLGDNAFKNISMLKKVSIGSGITNYSFTTFASSNNIETLEIAIKEIPAGAFAGKNNLKNVTLTNNVNKIGAGSFSSTGIEEITIPSSVTVIENGSFQGSNSLTKVINNTGKSFDWNGIIKGSSSSGESFETGTVTVGDRTVEITNQ